jgi:hypothetical protein
LRSMDEVLEVAACRFVVGDVHSEDLPEIATQALVRGVDSPSLRELAGTSAADVRKAADLFRAALDELGAPLLSKDDALWRLVRRAARQMLSGDLRPAQGASWIWANAAHEVDEEGDLRIFIGLASERQDHPEAGDEIDAQIIEAATELLARPSPRRWLRVQARNGEPPLKRSRSRGLEPTLAQDLGISSGLSNAVSQWAKDYAATFTPAASGFESQAAAEAFVYRGRALAADLQRELGDSWHVEYYPEPIRPPGLRLCGG